MSTFPGRKYKENRDIDQLISTIPKDMQKIAIQTSSYIGGHKVYDHFGNDLETISGQFWDDFGMILCRYRAQTRRNWVLTSRK